MTGEIKVYQSDGSDGFRPYTWSFFVRVNGLDMRDGDYPDEETAQDRAHAAYDLMARGRPT
jgi:hypothetical protein